MSEAPPDDTPTAVLDPVEQDRPRQIPKVHDGADDVFRGVLRSGGLAVLAITALIGIFLVVKASSALSRAGWHFFTRSVWLPDSNNFGIATILPNGVIIAVIALVIAV